MKLTLPKIYPITDVALSGLSHLEQVRRLVDGGASFIQLRDKVAPTAEFYNAALEAVQFARTRNVAIIINDRVDIALAAGAAGVHLGQEDLPPESARELLGPKAIIGFSTHSIDEAMAAIQLPVNYIAIGPIFATSTKNDTERVVGIEAVRRIRKAIGEFPTVAIGGIRLENAAAVLSAGADSVAMIGDIVSDSDRITERIRQLLRMTGGVY